MRLVERFKTGACVVKRVISSPAWYRGTSLIRNGSDKKQAFLRRKFLFFKGKPIFLILVLSKLRKNLNLYEILTRYVQDHQGPGKGSAAGVDPDAAKESKTSCR